LTVFPIVTDILFSFEGVVTCLISFWAQKNFLRPVGVLLTSQQSFREVHCVSAKRKLNSLHSTNIALCPTVNWSMNMLLLAVRISMRGIMFQL
jgi:hypothetical protein